MIWQRSVVAKEEVPEFYLWSETEGTKSRVYVSTQKVVPYAIRIQL